MAQQDYVEYTNGAEVNRVTVQVSDEGPNAMTLRQKADAIISKLEADCGTKATWDGLSAAQRQETTRQGLLALAKLARLSLGRFDGS